jgi:anthranilate phosphoribosyltransferase
VDTCGTGGGSIPTLNISTAAAFVVAGTGVRVAKHGNRSFTSRSGSADVLEALGVATDTEPAQAATILEAAGLVFLFAPTYHPAMRHVAPVRRALGVPTIMNLVGPLANPAGVTRQVVGVADPRHGPLVARALLNLGSDHALVVHGSIGVDELSPVGENLIWEVGGGGVSERSLRAETLGLGAPDLTGLEGGEPAENAAAIRGLFERPGEAASALRGAVLLNAAAAMVVSGRAGDLESGAALASESLLRGGAAAALAALRTAAPLRTSG